MNVSFDVDCIRYLLNKNVSSIRDGFISSHENRDVRVGDVRYIEGRMWRVTYVTNMFPGWFSSQVNGVQLMTSRTRSFSRK